MIQKFSKGSKIHSRLNEIVLLAARNKKECIRWS